jgi:hypothetical protein
MPCSEAFTARLIKAIAAGLAAHEVDHEFGQHRNDNAQRQHVEQNGREDEGEGRLPPRRILLRARPFGRGRHRRRFLPA